MGPPEPEGHTHLGAVPGSGPARYVIKIAGKDAYTFEWAIQGPDGTWKTLGEGKSTRVK